MNELLDQAQLGIETETFLSSKLGKYLIERADNELILSKDALVTVDPFDHTTIMKLQMQSQMAINFKLWLLEAIQTGRYAEEELKDG